MARKIRALLFILYLLPSFGGMHMVYAQPAEKHAVLAVLTLNLARFTDWPEAVFDNASPVLHMCVIGNNVVQQSFAKIDNKHINNKSVHIINLSRLRNLSQCHLIYISELEHKTQIQVLLELKNMPILTVGENMQFIKDGGMIAIEKVAGKMQLNINLSIIKQSGLVVSSRILKLAKIYHPPYPVP